MTPAKFRALVWRYYRAHGRHDLPWRRTHDLYQVLVSEMMLQQTQVDRVVPLYKAFIKKFPTAKRLVAAPLAEVLRVWQGLGYNRRAKMLREAAVVLCSVHFLTYRSESERTVGSELVGMLEELPGVGPYTARAVAAFAYNQDVVVIETNIRTAVIHHFFVDKEEVSDAEIEKVLIQTLPKGRAREWYSALMDYGASLKRAGISHNIKSQKYMKQSKFAGSLRQARGAILKRLALGSASRATLVKLLDVERRPQLLQALTDLCREGLIKKSDRLFTLAD